LTLGTSRKPAKLYLNIAKANSIFKRTLVQVVDREVDRTVL